MISANRNATVQQSTTVVSLLMFTAKYNPRARLVSWKFYPSVTEIHHQVLHELIIDRLNKKIFFLNSQNFSSYFV